MMGMQDKLEWVNERNKREMYRENIHKSFKMGVFQQKYHISDTENLRVTKNDAKEDGCFLSKNYCYIFRISQPSFSPATTNLEM